MLEMNNMDGNKRFITIDDQSYLLTVGCKTILNKGIITNYLINIEDYAGSITVLLDKNGDSMLSQLSL
ncbi:DUF6440 family protein [Clostridium lacusfryxellense]|uniref:DUF6440 family protein n=1 Tax=Clostridium lacusfryxellense TaxID=205328 RepID=UPI001C0DD3C6|nr:DUF6440 family protein [Clostridium lacusfryxellense]MBU3111214.1 hypothetical protein [Clostridium lacusfryxellense]